MRITLKTLGGVDTGFFATIFAREEDWTGDNLRAAIRAHLDVLWFLENVGVPPANDTRAAACEDPLVTSYYARFVDKAPREDTRAAACRDPEVAIDFAKYVDKGPHEDTRAAAHRDPYVALIYERAWPHQTV